MNMKKRGLNKGLDSLLGDLKSFRERNHQNEIYEKDSLVDISINLIEPNPNQPRKYFNPEEIDNLANSIKAEGIIQPIVVRKKNNIYQIIAGERRYRAAHKINLKTIPCVIKHISDQSASLISLIENLQRENLNPIEQANSFNQLIFEFNFTHEKLAKHLGISRVNVSNILRLLKLSDFVKEALVSKKIDMGHARALIPLSEKEQIELCNKIITQSLTTREVEKFIQPKIKKNIKNKSVNQKDADTKQIEEMLSNFLSTQVEIDIKTKEKGVVKIHYSSLESLNGILEKIKRLSS